jgi:ubiquinone/menaquinone biosynthesis C-methylase UbiE
MEGIHRMVDTRNFKAAAISTFSARAKSYRFESRWVEDLTLIDPLLLDPPCEAAKLLDVCGGTGRLADRATQLGWRSALCDLVGDMLEARYNKKIPAIQADAALLPFRDSSFDRIVVRQGLHYLEAPTALSEFARVARSVALGHIVAQAPEDVTVWQRYFAIASPGRRDVLVRGSTESLLASSGFRIEHLTTKRSVARIGDSIRHLEGSSRNAALKTFIDAPEEFKDRYEIAEKVTEETTYAMLWEFIIARS